MLPLVIGSRNRTAKLAVGALGEPQRTISPGATVVMQILDTITLQICKTSIQANVTAKSERFNSLPLLFSFSVYLGF